MSSINHSCPLCNSEKYILHKTYSIEELSALWKGNFAFDPFQNIDCRHFSKRQCIRCHLIYYSDRFEAPPSLYESLSELDWYYEEDKWEFDAAIKYTLNKKPGKVLEIGCGNGNFLRKVNPAVARAEGVDINPKAIDYCKQMGLTVYANTKEISDKYDIIFMFEVLEHLDNFQDLFHDLVDKLADNGSLIIATPNPEGYIKDINNNLLDLPPHHTSGWSKATYDFVAQQYNLKIVDYQLEPLRMTHHLTYVNHVHNLNQHIKTSPKDWKGKLFQKLGNAKQRINSTLLGKLDYLLFRMDQQHLTGQTHLVIYAKVST